ncbi:hypothetical protein COT98_04535 [Candidatus Falkowbacteria bacterium CG10_big_fil_rev_8_21_14_0_10_39_9]|uniref:Uncharacterized protein n=1 Tax=Candidatus Falkowbacteria bacterium CG10_big_fil_rev_8_21_14_0_10_39_9 TaxID=1974566 RepID=A0A2M6WN64_9BACT|nr:MAG: hypothetical protein COT98_04535 [Candidatus Falkowbacteria bacterium CG10_big_fil_rev_8_21_14_0_10_39_9]
MVQSIYVKSTLTKKEGEMKNIKNETGEHHPFNQNDYLGGNKQTNPKANLSFSRTINYVTHDGDSTGTHYILLNRMTEEEFYSKNKEEEIKVRNHFSATEKFKRGDLNPHIE